MLFSIINPHHKKMELKNITLLTAAFCLLTASCKTSDNKETKIGTYIPSAPDYADKTMWYEEKNDTIGTGADVFYIVATWEFDWQTEDSVTCHYADPVNKPKHRSDMAIEIKKIATYMGIGNNYYAPYYRHISLNSWIEPEDTINNRYFSVAFKDIQNSFNYFIKEKNNGRPFILAGFSQGAKSVVELIKTMPDSVVQRMVAAYVMGYKVTAQDTARCKNLKPALKSNDTGVTICYNTVSDAKYIKPVLCDSNIFCINPVNWQCDSSTATISDSIKVTLSPSNKVLIVEGFDGSAYRPILNMINVGDYHGAEPYLYQEYIKQNVSERIETYNKHKH